MMKYLSSAILVATTLTMTSAAANENDWSKEAKDAWIDGKTEAVLLFNGNLDSFDINTTVKKGEVTLTGEVESDVERKLAEELVHGVDGVKAVNNELTVMKSDRDGRNDSNQNDNEVGAMVDTKIAVVLKSRYLLDSDIDGTDINVDVENGHVSLSGEVDSTSEKQLAIQMAKNIDDVVEVSDDLTIITAS
ncbi:BON domain-containing protein [Thalassotalea sp. 1_MG-2023]|uniref:BON domain-containing protein n=1 Tax=Thalassotalea sp. 1_MG-2023 TaxID=3062680 RepID=UPI0026E172E0|nr:BON domain-containing protein [Thalassotalea sp. 1_MG-2023]MDO6425569.1 BON domain-containing protein [Thalassotalea sp. 1_MG-2023]